MAGNHGERRLTTALNGSLTLSALEPLANAHSPAGVQMFKFLKKLWRDRRGNALIIAGAALPLIVGSAGLASDTIEWSLWKRQLQRLADSGAEAGVYAIVEGNTVDNCSNISSATSTTPVAYSIKTNNHLPQVPTCAATNPPSVGGYTADSNAVRVNVSMQRPLSFSGMFLRTAPTISASATATIVPAGQYCAISLIKTATTGISAGGNATVNLGCGMITDSTSMTAAVAFGSSSVTASPVAAVGGISASNNWGSGTVLQPFTISQPDPFANVNPPTPTNCHKFSDWDTGNNNKPGGTVDLTQAGSPLLPAGGTYCIKESGGNFTVKGNITLPAGTYVLDQTSLTMTNSNASLSCSQCTFILTSSTGSNIGTVSLQGGKLNITAPDTGTYKGIAIYQDRRATQCTSSNCNLVNGNSSSFLQGALYFPNQQLTFTGTAGESTSCLQLVALTLTFSGTSAINNSCPTGSASQSFAGQKVRLVE
jgi:Flp pilus assembly protein TadG